MRDTALLAIGVLGALWCAVLVQYALVHADRGNRDLLAGLTKAFGDLLVTLGKKRGAERPN